MLCNTFVIDMFLQTAVTWCWFLMCFSGVRLPSLLLVTISPGWINYCAIAHFISFPGVFQCTMLSQIARVYQWVCTMVHCTMVRQIARVYQWLLYGGTRSILKDLLLVLWYLLSIIFHPHPYSKSKWVGEHDKNREICHVLCASCIMLIYEHICLYTKPRWRLLLLNPLWTEEIPPRMHTGGNSKILPQIKWKHILYTKKNFKI